jgi:hypothetical protein
MSSRSSPSLSPLSAIPEELSISYFPEESDRKVDSKLQQALESLHEVANFKQELSKKKRNGSKAAKAKTSKEKFENYGMEGAESVTSISLAAVPGVLNLKLNIEEEF